MIYSSPKKIKNLEIKNRFVRSATAERRASNNYVDEKTRMKPIRAKRNK